MKRLRRAGAPASVLLLLSACLADRRPATSQPPMPTPTPRVATPSQAPPPAAAVPPQPTPASTPSRRYLEILKLKQSGVSDEVLLEKIRAENLPYTLNTTEILELRQAGVSEEVVEAMLRSGR
jgi:hypothetical protein